MQTSPYTPGTIAHDIIGRDSQIEQIQQQLALLATFPRFMGRIEVYVGSRGVGKTSLLRRAQHYAEELGFHTVWVTAGDSPFIAEVIASLQKYMHGWTSQAAKALKVMLQSLSVSIAGISFHGAGVGEETKSAHNVDGIATGGLGRQLQEVLEKASEAAKAQKKKGLAIFIDEIQAADTQGLRAFAYAWQHMQSEAKELPMIAMTAGLSHTQDVITDAVSFAERFRYVHLDNLSAEDSREVIERLAMNKNVRWEEQAVAKALSHAGGYPYFLQLIGDLAWEYAGNPDPGAMVLETHVDKALVDFQTSRDAFFRARWMKASEKEIELMIAIASHKQQPVKRSDVAAQLGVPTSAISMARRSLMDKGLIESTAHGYMEFTAPGFAQYIRTMAGTE
ncbi:ATP-binding protein [Corynebacterium sp. sy039]|uniref:ATP-binding protein n=1 Tax=Corynebacterium sp. sy039 TaxID=2599641 RepID=UPI0011B78F71|nr:ATP-binding protein [Corynebacterium sp. sy039]QDZ41971.1 AAA family ATPase [Corynebacterium sp. sy039]